MTPTTTLLERVAWDSVNDRVRHEQRNREVYVPPISLYRWWARRPHALIGALIDAACESRTMPVSSDPFSGGGTVALEAARRGLPLYAQDLHPWAVTGLATALDGVRPEALAAATSSVLSAVEIKCASLYATTCPDHGETSELSHVFWVRIAACPECSRQTHLFPYSLLTLASRQTTETQGYFGCPACGLLSRHRATGKSARTCPGCDRRLAPPDTPLLADRHATCAYSDCMAIFPAFDRTSPVWLPVLVQRVCLTSPGRIVHFDSPTAEEAASGHSVVVPAPLREKIPDGMETSLLRRAGFVRWSDLYPSRQLKTLTACATAIDELDASAAIQSRLRLALCGAGEMAGYLSRWDRYYPKAFEAMANHRFAALGFACETNLLSSRGRGTLRRRFAHSVAASRWSEVNMPIDGAVRMASSSDNRRRVNSGAVLACGSSERQLPSTESVDLVLTDPPYFDDVQYAELASLFFVWARSVNLIANSVTLDVASEAVVNSPRGSGLTEYREMLTRIFSEAWRTLKPTGRLILTFHNTDIQAWWALSRALYEAELTVHAIAVAEAENGSDHAKRNSQAFTSDLVIECRPSTLRHRTATIVGNSGSQQSQELYAAGQVLASGGHLEMAEFIEEYREIRGKLTRPRIHIPALEMT